MGQLDHARAPAAGAACRVSRRPVDRAPAIPTRPSSRVADRASSVPAVRRGLLDAEQRASRAAAVGAVGGEVDLAQVRIRGRRLAACSVQDRRPRGRAEAESLLRGVPEGCDELQQRFPNGRFEWLPFGVDANGVEAPTMSSATSSRTGWGVAMTSCTTPCSSTVRIADWNTATRLSAESSATQVSSVPW